MKKIILVITILLFSNTVKSQITKGYWMIGGDANFDYINSKDDISNPPPNWSFKISPNIGCFIKDKLVIGTAMTYFKGKNTNGYFLFFKPFIRYYFFKPKEKINYFSELSAYYGKYFLKSGSLPKDTGYIFKTGMSYFLNDIVALEFSIKYTVSNIDLDNKVIKGLQTGIGLQIHLEKK